MLDFIYWITGIIITIIFGYIGYKFMKKIKNVKINQKAKKMENIKGVDLELGDDEKLLIKNMDITQEAQQMKEVTGMSIKANGKQSARLQGVQIKQPGKQIVISDDPDIIVEVNKQVRR